MLLRSVVEELYVFRSESFIVFWTPCPVRCIKSCVCLLGLVLQVVWSRWPAEWEEEVAPLLWLCSGCAVCCGPQQLWYEDNGGPLRGKFQNRLIEIKYTKSTAMLNFGLVLTGVLLIGLNVIHIFPRFPSLELAPGKSWTFYIHLQQHSV